MICELFLVVCVVGQSSCGLKYYNPFPFKVTIQEFEGLFFGIFGKRQGSQGRCKRIGDERGEERELGWRRFLPADDPAFDCLWAPVFGTLRQGKTGAV